MIHYNLRCGRGHAFESWFQSSSAYESQEKRKLISCPTCGSDKVERAIMAPRVVSKKGRERSAPEPTPASMDVAAPAAAHARPLPPPPRRCRAPAPSVWHWRWRRPSSPN